MDEVAEILSLSLRTVKTIIAKKQLGSAIVPGTRSRRISRKELDRFLARL